MMTNGLPVGPSEMTQPNIWAELDLQAREAYRRAFERQFEFITFINERIGEWQTHTQKLAYEMWVAGDQQPGKALDHWLTAEKEVWGPIRERIQALAFSMWEAAGSQHGKALDDWLEAQKAIFSPVWEQIRDLAHSNWEATGRQQDKTLTYWLDAEKRVLEMLKLTGGHQNDATGGSGEGST
jgi:hypothetical protein